MKHWILCIDIQRERETSTSEYATERLRVYAALWLGSFIFLWIFDFSFFLNTIAHTRVVRNFTRRKKMWIVRMCLRFFFWFVIFSEHINSNSFCLRPLLAKRNGKKKEPLWVANIIKLHQRAIVSIIVIILSTTTNKNNFANAIVFCLFIASVVCCEKKTQAKLRCKPYQKTIAYGSTK